MPAVVNDINRKKSYQQFAITFALLLSFVIAARVSDVNIMLLFDKDGIGNASQILSSFFKPDFSLPFLQRIFLLSLESLYIGILGTLIGAIFGVVLAIVGARLPNLPDPPGKSNPIVDYTGYFLQSCARFLLVFFRAVPDVVWAYLFVMLLGLGPGPAVLAIAFATCGIVGKLFAELAEAVDARLVHCVRSTGTGRSGAWWHCVLPQVKRQWVAYALFRMECNIRSGTILGVVGAGGLGSEIALSIRYFEYDKLATALFAVLVFVIILEFVSAFLRNRSLRWTITFALFAGSFSVLSLKIPWSQLFSAPSMIVLGVEHMSVSTDFLFNAFSLSIETLLMAWCATMIAAVFAFFFAPLATKNLVSGSYLRSAIEKRGGEKWRAWGVLSGARFLLQIFRAMPELTFALIFVVWVGPGPFAGVLAIAAHTFGVFGRLYTDVYEEVEHAPPSALQSAGVGGVGVWIFGVLPQIMPRLLAFTLYRFEVNVRATATVGFVGAGGIGDAIHSAISLFHFADLFVLISVLILVVVCVDFLGSRVRLRILRRSFTHSNKIQNSMLLPSLGDTPSKEISQHAKAWVQFRTQDQQSYIPAIPNNVTSRGMFLSSEKFIPIGTQLLLQLSSTEQEIPFQINARVIDVEQLASNEFNSAYRINVEYMQHDETVENAVKEFRTSLNTNSQSDPLNQY